MAVHTPLPRNLRWGLAAFSGSLFINNKTRDSGTAHTYHPGTGSGAWRPRDFGGGVVVFAVTPSPRACPAHHQSTPVPLSQEHPTGPCAHPSMRGKQK